MKGLEGLKGKELIQKIEELQAFYREQSMNFQQRYNAMEDLKKHLKGELVQAEDGQEKIPG